ncbi:MAG: deoxyguanosinetriphosphate triphosphohydrolase [Alphaproteobacteria bacterium]|nr:deoxyguanosinetriphosphate triphosphohydrolase [Alphaproteobacteria bacterium]MCB9984362.1 deoxyguanosinetriphosphate triphosphohydrolase [Micavibrio sp.]HPQ50264.1 deoxyguanosinetriphosphate triphosphohydrolase [Alphaproteobacteria bacterium]
MIHDSEDNSTQAYNYCALPLAAYACRPDLSRGRLIEEPESRHRTAFQRDRDRIIHSSAFRRLKDKTQVFVAHEGDHYRTRLSHTLEVAQITRTLARCLMVNEDLAEAVALAHDLGHTPFAHMGEDSLKICMEDWGGFAHNDQSLRILTTLEQKYPLWNGLNLTWETLEGVAKHNGPVLQAGEAATRANLSVALFELNQKMDLELHHYASIEAQVAAISDDIAYNNHDIEDGLRAGMFSLEDIAEVDLIGEGLVSVKKAYGTTLGQKFLISETIRTTMGDMVDDVLKTSKANLKKVNPQSPADVARAGIQIVSFSEEMNEKVNELRKFLCARMYRHFEIERIRLKVEKIIPDLFHAFHENYGLLPEHWQARVEMAGGETDLPARARIVCDYIAGMTDRYAIQENERLFNPSFGMK